MGNDIETVDRPLFRYDLLSYDWMGWHSCMGEV